jgi:hypothetical protein
MCAVIDVRAVLLTVPGAVFIVCSVLVLIVSAGIHVVCPVFAVGAVMLVHR